ncbi:hypothetical protein GLOIN_2v1877516 [Rhizophagus irregularis DAOM 181602=DAOM 197198]|uniref:Uncharacterized protein n=1 Tax=Rhizophagus irregularis (strain DAOM 181602 / DAOM 197198 / MUCL 43194) TaxID=747089 RepID=A0A2P4PVL2_RHIID|nr:hypothetical protein GLOIN_2v1877516 [Rhizophagus irregularis DAOM 181602=DAOM 197198]POG69437.1 hypothetical protein GLOIN_2v1877516 [Rhizophagus irregularis DAOM 181602=DAOM 197198]|eukprot:XP_025176303.1 hypothetical protein GLOIN_2v1877516 [Rhizophagus irregularis DAOM 181602=DAOM 197198]
MHLTLAGIMNFPKKEINVTQNAKVVSIKIDFVEWLLPKKGNNVSYSDCEIEDNPTNAITSLYRQIFKTQTKISGSVVMADKLTIMVFSLGASKKESSSPLHLRNLAKNWNFGKIPSNKELMNSLYEYYLKRQTIVGINWLQLFKHDREMQAWSSMLKAAGCTDIIPFNSEISLHKFCSRSLDPMDDKML